MSSRARVAVAALVLASPTLAHAQGLEIDHKAVGCIVAGKFPKMNACFSPASSLARARVYFRPEGTPSWYYVEMKSDTPCWAGVLPKPSKKLVQKKIEYYVEGQDKSFTSGRTAEYAPIVVANAQECKKEVPVAPISAAGPAAVFPAVPAGFAAGGAAIGATTVALGVAGVGAAAAGVAAATGGNDTTTAPTTAPSQQNTTTTIPATMPPTTPPTTTPGSTNHAPNAVLKTIPDPPQGLSPLNVTFDFCASMDPDGDPLSFFYDFGDGTNASGACSLSHTYTATTFRAGVANTSYSFQGCVVDNKGASSCRTRTVVVSPPPTKIVLSVSKGGTGSGTVKDDQGQIDCGASCTGSYNSGTIVTLTASPDANSSFTGWSGGGCSGTGTCVVTLTAATTVKATFDSFSLAVTVSESRGGTGTVTSSPSGINCPSSKAGNTCVANFPGGTSVTLTATGSLFFFLPVWGGDCSTATGNTCTLTMGANHTVTVDFANVGFRRPSSENGALLSWRNELAVVDAAGQVFFNGAAAASTTAGPTSSSARVVAGENRVEGLVTSATGKAGTWRFDFSGDARFTPGSLRVLQGELALVTDTAIVFRLRGESGERVAFTLSVR